MALILYFTTFPVNVCLCNSVNQRHNLPEGSNITFEPAFNGAGYAAMGLKNTGLVDASNEYLGKYVSFGKTQRPFQLFFLTFFFMCI